jgi:hypothetical protein
MTHPRSFFHAFKKTSGFAHTAAMFVHGRKHFFKAITETFNGICGALLHFFKIKTHLDKIGAAHTPVIGAFQHFNVDDVHAG